MVHLESMKSRATSECAGWPVPDTRSSLCAPAPMHARCPTRSAHQVLPPEMLAPEASVLKAESRKLTAVRMVREPNYQLKMQGASHRKGAAPHFILKWVGAFLAQFPTAEFLARSGEFFPIVGFAPMVSCTLWAVFIPVAHLVHEKSHSHAKWRL